MHLLVLTHSHDPLRLVSALQPGEVWFVFFILYPRHSTVRSLTFTPDLTILLPWYFTIRIALAICGTKLLSGSHDRCIRVWDLSDEEMTEVRKLRGHGGSVLALAVAGDRVLSGR